MENDASVSHVSHEKTASTVETATTKVERTTSRNASETTGRTAWDALVESVGCLVAIHPGSSWSPACFTAFTNLQGCKQR